MSLDTIKLQEIIINYVALDYEARDIETFISLYILKCDKLMRLEFLSPSIAETMVYDKIFHIYICIHICKVK